MLEEREDLLLLVMIMLLLLLSVVIWVAFCIAVKRTAVKFLELKRQRRREVGSLVYTIYKQFIHPRKAQENDWRQKKFC